MDRENEKRAEVVRVRAAFCILVLVANRSVELEERNRFESNDDRAWESLFSI